MKKIISISLVLMLLLGILAVPAVAEDRTCGTLSYLNMTEEEDTNLSSVRRPMMRILFLHGVVDVDKVAEGGKTNYLFFDTMNDLLLALQAGKVDAIKVPYYTAKYLCSTNDELKLNREYHLENATGVAEWALSLLSDGYSFMLKEDNTALKDAFDAQLTAMKEDGTLQKLVDEHIIKVSEGGEPVAVAFEKFEGDPIKVGVTGDLPPMDYVAPDGTFAGFNTAVLAEIGKRLQKNIELVQVENVGRALALSEGVVDVVFWTRSMSEKMVESLAAKRGLSKEEQEAKRAGLQEVLTDEEKALLGAAGEPTDEEFVKIKDRDLPPSTIITQPYFSDFPVWVLMK
ncbi:MAG: transporter substrate-binding domain-containing protein, partial [Clostridia bacterium]